VTKPTKTNSIPCGGLIVIETDAEYIVVSAQPSEAPKDGPVLVPGPSLPPVLAATVRSISLVDPHALEARDILDVLQDEGGASYRLFEVEE
jgi:hypothetical protein